MRVRIFGQYLHVSVIALAAFEAVLLYLVLFGATFVRFHYNFAAAEHSHGPVWPRALLFSAATIASLLAFGLYSARQRARSVGLVVRIVAAVSAGVGISAVVIYLVPYLDVGRGVLAGAAIGAVAVAFVVRLGFDRLLDDVAFKRRVLVYGTGKNATALARLRRRSDQRGFTLVGFVQPEGEGAEIPSDRILSSGRDIMPLCAAHQVDEVVVAMDDRRQSFPIRELLECRLAGVSVTELLTFLERETGRVRIDLLNPSWLIFGEGFRRGNIRLFTSRALDLLASLTLLIVGSPLMLVVALTVKLEEGWRAPVLYHQERVGLGGKTFQLLKFRSMRPDAENGQAVWAQRNDPRVTRVGAIIRKLRIDEMPQLVNVLRGEMSFVGPRPERPQFVEELAEKIPYYIERHCVKPGITGWAQLCYPYGATEKDALEKLQYDLYYIKNNSFLFDLAILIQTIEVVFMGKGAR